MSRLLWAFLISWVLSGLSFADSWVINKDHSEVQFQVEYLSISEVGGRFKNFSGSVVLNEQQVPEQIVIKVETASVDTGNNLRDGHLKANDFFQSQKYPFILFKGQSISSNGPGNYKVSGLLTIKNISRPFAVEFSLSDPINDTWNYKNRFVKFKSKINRSSFNLKWNKTLDEQKYLVGEEVKLWGIFQIQPSLTKTPSSKHMIPDTKYLRERERVARGEIVKNEPELILDPPRINIIKPGVAESTSSSGVKVPDNYRDNIWWWVSLWVISLLGFFAAMIVAFYSKNLFVEYFPRNYKENGILGYISDLVVIFFVMLYCLAFWFLGWGVR
jgi:polyisoprenoid-binding protein YceI